MESVKPILSLIDQREKILEEKKEFEATSSDPTRLLKKAGDPGRLLKEERFRKVIAKELPKLEEKLRKTIMEWEQKNHVLFMFNGQRLLDQLEMKENRDERAKEYFTPNPKTFATTFTPTTTTTTPKVTPKHLRTVYPQSPSSSQYRSPVLASLTTRVALSPVNTERTKRGNHLNSSLIH